MDQGNGSLDQPELQSISSKPAAHVWADGIMILACAQVSRFALTRAGRASEVGIKLEAGEAQGNGCTGRNLSPMTQLSIHMGKLFHQGQCLNNSLKAKSDLISRKTRTGKEHSRLADVVFLSVGLSVHMV